MVRFSTRFVATVFAAVVGGFVLSGPASADEQLQDASDRMVSWLASVPVSPDSLEQRLDRALAYQVAGAPKALVTPLVRDVEFLLAEGVDASALVLAKVVIVRDVAGRSGVAMQGGRDVVAELRAASGAPPAAPGEYLPETGRELETQAWGILAEMRLGNKPANELRFLLAQLCAEGWYVTSPSAQTCQRPVDLREQALLASVLMEAGNRGLVPTSAGRSLLATIEKQMAGDVANTLVSTRAWLAQSALASGDPGGANSLGVSVASLQLTKRSALDPSHVGALGGETRKLRSDLLKQKLSPVPAHSIAGLHALNPVELTGFTHSPRPSLSRKAKALPSVVGPDTLEAGGTARFLAQGFAPGAELKLTSVGSGKTLVRAKVDGKGRATLKFGFGPSADPNQELRFTDDKGNETSMRIAVVRPLQDVVDTSTTADVLQPKTGFALGPVQAIALLLLVLVAVVLGARLLRVETS